jgi:hypothetical protein
MLTDRPAISVLVPTYNAEPFLNRTLASILAQTDPDFELILSDNGSTDGTLDIARQVASTDQRVQVVRNSSNLGLHGNMVTLISRARGRLVKYVMADDLLLPTALQTLRRPLDEDSSISISTSRRFRIDEHDELLPADVHTEAPVASSGRLDGKTLANRLLETQANLIGEPTTAMFRRGDVDPTTMCCLRGLRYAALVDMVLWLKLLATGDCYYEVEPQSCYRRHTGQMAQATGMPLVDRWEWIQLLLDAPSLGYLTDPGQEARALQRRITDMLANAPLADVSTSLSSVTDALVRALARLGELHRRAGGDNSEFLRFREQVAGNPAAIARELETLPAASEDESAADAVPNAEIAPSAESAAGATSRSANRPAVTIVLSVFRSTRRAFATLGPVLDQVSPDSLCVLLDAGAEADDDILTLNDITGNVVRLAVTEPDSEKSWEAGIRQAPDGPVLLLSEGIVLSSTSIDHLVTGCLSDQPSAVSPLIIGSGGTGVSGDLSSPEGVCLLGQRSSLLGPDDLELVVASDAHGYVSSV